MIMEQLGALRIRRYGETGPVVIVLHGGPAAVGNAAPIARGLADSFRVIEPWQRGSGSEPLTVALHVADLHELVTSLGEGTQPALVGESWGAMLALAYAAAHPENVSRLVLVGCGTFDQASRVRMKEVYEERMDDDLRRRLARLPEEKYELLRPLYTYAQAVDGEEGSGEPFDKRAHTETWNEMLRLQEEGVYPAAFSAITSPVLMLHGAYDPHPGRMIYEGLKRHIPQIEYREWERCGHSPWLEKFVREEFFSVLRARLMTAGS